MNPRSKSPAIMRRHVVGGGLAAMIAVASGRPRAARAAALAAPSDEVILTITGKVRRTNSDLGARFDLAMLDALPQRDTVTATPWHEGRPTFSGPTLASVLDAVGAEGATMRFHALNDYEADVPAEDARKIPVILATRIDGMPVSVRDKGPILVVYPFDERPELFNEVYFNRSVWQVESIEVLE